MKGAHNSLSTRLKDDVPDLFITKCVCYFFSLCANYACEKLPETIEELGRNIHTFLQYFCNIASDDNPNFVNSKNLWRLSHIECSNLHKLGFFYILFLNAYFLLFSWKILIFCSKRNSCVTLLFFIFILY